MSTGSELTPARQEETPPPSETTSPDLECAAELYWHALKHRVIDPDPNCVAYAQSAMAALVAGKGPAFLRQKRNGRHIDNSSARLAALRDGAKSFPALDWSAEPVQGHA
jgi:hypothetical protein